MPTVIVDIKTNTSVILELSDCLERLKKSLPTLTSMNDLNELFGYGYELGRIEELGRRIEQLAISAKQDMRYTMEPKS